MTQELLIPLRLRSLFDAVCDELATPEQSDELEAILQNDENARHLYLDYCSLHVDLHFAIGGQQSKVALEEKICAQAVQAPAMTASSFPTFLGNAIHGTIGYFSLEGIPFAYLVATVLTGLGILIGSMIYVSRPEPMEQIAKNSLPMPTIVEPALAYVGRITGMVDCKWVQSPESRVRSPALDPQPSSLVSLGEKFTLASGLMEITYDTGAKVILQGPCTYKVESSIGGFLSLGKLTAKVEKKVASGQWSVDSKSQIDKSQIPKSSSLSTIHYPLFTINTPTATVTDLGTEFGVEVDANQVAAVVVFQGQVDVESRIHGTKSHVRRLAAGEALRVNPSGEMASDVDSIGERFAGLRALPKQESKVLSRILLHDTFKNAANSEKYMFSEDGGLNWGRHDRQTGRLAPAWYFRGGVFTHPFHTRVHYAGHPDGLCLFLSDGETGWLVFDRDFPPNVELSARLDPVAFRCGKKSYGKTLAMGDTASYNWVALSVRGRGTEPDSLSLPKASNAGAVFLIRSNGGWNYWENGILIADSDGIVGGAADQYLVRMRVIGNGLDIFVNGVALDLDPTGPATARTLQGEAAKLSHNFIGFGAYNSDSPPDLTNQQVSVLFDLQVTAVESPDRTAQPAIKSE